MCYAAKEQVFFDADGLKYRVSDLTLRCYGQYNVLDFMAGYVRFSYAGKRVDFDKFLFWLRRFSWEIDADTGVSVTVFTFAPATAAPAGTEFEYPDESTLAPPDDTPRGVPTTWTPPVGLHRGTGTLAFIADDGYLYIGDTRTVPVVWARYSLVSLGMAGTAVMPIQDAFTPANLGLVTSTNAYRLLNFGSASRSLASSYAFRYTTLTRSFQSERGVNGLFAVASHPYSSTGYGTDIEVSSDSCATWTRYADQFGQWVGGDGNGIGDGMFVSPTGKLITSGIITTPGTAAQLKQSSNLGLSWSTLGSGQFYVGTGDIHVPVQITDDHLIYHGGGISPLVARRQRLYKTLNGVQSEISPTHAPTTTTFGPAFQFGIKSCDVNLNELVCVGWDDFVDYWGVFVSHNAGASWTPVVTPNLSSVVLYRACAIAGDDPRTFWLHGLRAIAITRDGGTTFTDLTGNLAALGMSAGARILNVFGVS